MRRGFAEGLRSEVGTGAWLLVGESVLGVVRWVLGFSRSLPSGAASVLEASGWLGEGRPSLCRPYAGGDA